MDSRLIVDESFAGLRLDLFLVKSLAGHSRSQIQKLIKGGNVTVNNEKISAHHWLKKGDVISIVFSKEREPESVPSIEIVGETPEFAVINKPAGIVAHPDSRHKSGTVVDFLLDKYPEIKDVGDLSTSSRQVNLRPGIVHRLDKEASGLMIAARTQKNFENLKKQFQSRTVEKEYLVLIHDPNLSDQGEITTPLGRSKISGKIVARPGIADQAKEAHTVYKVLERRKNFALVSVITKTGRTHQIRVHFHSIGHSVAGDKLYKQKRIKEKSEPPRLFLHCSRLAFKDIKVKRHEFSLKLAKDLQKFWDSLK